MNTEWKNKTIEILAEEVGPVATLIVSDVLDDLDLENVPMTSSHYAKFLLKLSSQIPTNPIEICRKCREQVV